MATTPFFVKYRPVRIGFIVRYGYIEDIIFASKINTLLWGGIYNPIIPVSDDFTFSNQLIKLFNVETLFPVYLTEEINIFLKNYEYLKSPCYSDWEIFYENWNSKKKITKFLDIVHILNYYWDKEFKAKPEKYKSNFALINWDEKDNLSNLFCVTFGAYPEISDLEYNYREIFLKALKAQEVNIKGKETVKEDLYSFISPLLLTREGLQSIGRTFKRAGIFIGDPNSFDDLLWFWNLRASGIDIYFLPINSARLNSFIRVHLLKLDKLPPAHPDIEDHIYIYFSIPFSLKKIKSAENYKHCEKYHTNYREKIQKHLEKFKIKKRLIFYTVSKDAWNGLNIKPLEFYHDHKKVLGDVHYKFNKYSVSIILPEAPFLKDKYIRDKITQISVVIEPLTESEYPKYTLKLPFIPELNEFFSHQITHLPNKLRVD